MTSYRRNFVKGGSYFFTVALADRRESLLVDHVGALRDAFHQVKTAYPFNLYAMVVLPEPLHCIWTLPSDDANYPDRWRRIKAAFSRRLPGRYSRSPSQILKGERGIWQRRYWEHTLRDEEDYRRHTDYIHYNPVKHQHVARVADWPRSTFHRYVEAGVYPEDWAGSGEIMKDEFGEARGSNDGLRYAPPILRKQCVCHHRARWNSTSGWSSWRPRTGRITLVGWVERSVTHQHLMGCGLQPPPILRKP